jgi:hypothetical protein
LGVPFRESLPTSWSVSPMFSSSSFKVSGLTLRSLIHFELIFVQGGRWWLVLVLYIQISSFPSTIY